MAYGGDNSFRADRYMCKINRTFTINNIFVLVPVNVEEGDIVYSANPCFGG